MRYVCDRSYERHDTLIIGGSPVRILRVAPVAQRVLSELESGADLIVTAPERALLTRLEDAGLIHPVLAIADDTVRHHRVEVITPVYRNDEHGPGTIAHTVAGAVVVDDGSTPPVPDATVRLEANQGPAAARNAGLWWLKAQGGDARYVIFLDADVDPGPKPDWYLPLLTLCEQDPRLAIVAPRITSSPGTSLLARYEATRSPLDLGSEPGRVQPGTRIGYVPSTALFCRVAALEEVGGFDATLRFGEDVDLVWRLLDAGWTCRYHPEVVVEHPPRPTWATWCRQRISYGSSAVPLALKHQARLAPARIHPISLATWAALLYKHPFIAAISVTGSALALKRRVPALAGTVASRMAVTGTWHSGRGLAQAVRRAWWPFLILASVFSARARRILVFSVLMAGPPRVDTAIAIADDLSYSVGLWKGLCTRTARHNWRAASWAILPQGSRRSTSAATVQT
jgi:mycofactocin glycosyltransferase